MESLLNQHNVWFLVLAMLWVLPWKGYALWTASKMGHKRWFIALIILNTFGLFEIFYVFYIAKRKPKDILNALNSKI
jgi:hypothetical protein